MKKAVLLIVVLTALMFPFGQQIANGEECVPDDYVGYQTILTGVPGQTIIRSFWSVSGIEYNFDGSYEAYKLGWDGQWEPFEFQYWNFLEGIFKIIFTGPGQYNNTAQIAIRGKTFRYMAGQSGITIPLGSLHNFVRPSMEGWFQKRISRILRGHDISKIELQANISVGGHQVNTGSYWNADFNPLRLLAVITTDADGHIDDIIKPGQVVSLNDRVPHFLVLLWP